MPEYPDDDLLPPMKVLRKRLNGVYRADSGFSGPTRRYVLIVAMLVLLASVPTLAAITVGSNELSGDRTDTMDIPFLPPASSGPVPAPSSQPPPPDDAQQGGADGAKAAIRAGRELGAAAQRRHKQIPPVRTEEPTPSGDKRGPSGNGSNGSGSKGDQSSGDGSSGDGSSGTGSSGDRPSGTGPSNNRWSDDRPSDDRPSGTGPGGGRSSGRSSSERPSGERPSGERPSGTRSDRAPASHSRDKSDSSARRQASKKKKAKNQHKTRDGGMLSVPGLPRVPEEKAEPDLGHDEPEPEMPSIPDLPEVPDDDIPAWGDRPPCPEPKKKRRHRSSGRSESSRRSAVAERPYNIRAASILERSYAPSTNRRHVSEARGEDNQIAAHAYRGHHRADTHHDGDRTPADHRSSRVGRHHAEPAEESRLN